ncbi:DUF6062 family protein [Thermococcus sp.]|uniref:DUF6062 family protein n=1 Tax=Thermococcus sp. TaxID=35749 RepID=UPI00262EB5AA|nr:DUF6062 family protein [Thermococcus sp.]
MDMDIIELEIKRSLEEEGCPVCRLIERFEREEIETILYEHPNDPEVRKAFQKSLGLCPRHAWKTLKLALSNPLLGPHGISVIYKDVLKWYLEGGQGTGECLLCKLSSEKEETLLESFSGRLSSFIDLYEKSPSLLCRRHYEEIVNRIDDEELKGKLEQIQRRKLEELFKRLERFIHSFDYRAEGKPSEEERRALAETVEFFAGREVGPGCRERRREKRWSLRLR